MTLLSVGSHSKFATGGLIRTIKILNHHAMTAADGNGIGIKDHCNLRKHRYAQANVSILRITIINMFCLAVSCDICGVIPLELYV